MATAHGSKDSWGGVNRRARIRVIARFCSQTGGTAECGLAETGDQMAHEASGGSTTTPVFDSTLAPEQRTDEQEQAADPLQMGKPVGSVRPVSFDQFLSVAALTPAQASFVAVQVLDAADMRGTIDGQHVVGACLGAVTFMRSGDVDAARPHADGGMPVNELLKQLVRNASRRLPAHPRPEQLLLLDRLEAAARDPLLEPGTRARELERALVDTLGSGAWQRLSGQLAALVDAFGHVTSGVPAPIDARSAPTPGEPTTALAAAPRAASAAPGPSQPVPRPAALTRHTPSRPPRRSRTVPHRARNRRVALVVLVLAAVLAGSGYVVFGGPVVGILESLGRGSQPAAPATTAPAPTSKQSQPHRGRAVPALAARHAGPITGVAVHKTARCRPAALCPVTVAVHLRPASTTRAVSWKVGSARLCKRGIAWSPRTTVTARPGWRTVYARSSVRVPMGRSLALIALTVAPARAQSRPVPVTGSPRHC